MQMTWPGAPTLYYGDEAGVCGWTDPDNRRTYPWGREDHELIDFHRETIRIHRENKALKKGSFKMLWTDYNVLSYGRFMDDNIIVVIVNNNDYEKEVHIPVWQLGIIDRDTVERLIESERDTFDIGNEEYTVVSGKLNVKVKGFSAVVYRKKL